MYQKFMIVTVMLLGIASCSAPKKAPYVRPVISVKTVEMQSCKETLCEVEVERIEDILVVKDIQN